MRKALSLSLLILVIHFSSAQDSDFRLGLKAAPVIGSSRVILDVPEVDIETDGSSFKFSIGLVVDKYFGDNYAIGTGLVYVPKEVSISIDPDPTNTEALNESETYKLQYLQIPATVKMFTNEIKPDMTVYFQLGLAMEIKVFQQADSELQERELISKFQPINIPVILGTGIEYRAGINTVIFGGVSYQRGLTNVVKETNISQVDDLEIRSTVFSIDLGLKF